MAWPNGLEVCRSVARDHPAVMLAFSGGKDSIGAWLAMRPHFSRVVPVYYYSIPDLGFIERGLKYYEEWFQTPIIRVPNPSFYRQLRNWVFQSPEVSRAEVLSAAGLPALTHEIIHREVGEAELGLPEQDCWVAIGTRANDSPQRRMAFNKWGPVRSKNRSFFPVWDWDKAKLIGEIQRAGVKLPPEYRVFGRSFDGIDFRFLHGVKTYWPEDYAKILHWFPLAECELKRHEFKLKRRQA